MKEKMKNQEWNNLDVIPPNATLEVCDALGNIAIAQPTYYPFKMVKKEGDEKKMWGWRGTPVFNENNQEEWDGGWMINIGMDMNKIGTVVKWRNR